MKFDRDYPKKDLPTLLDLTRDQVNQWAKFSDVFSPSKKKVKGKGRPYDVFSLTDLYRFAVFKNLFESGLSRKASDSCTPAGIRA